MFITFAAERHIGWRLPNMNLTLYCWEKKILSIVLFFIKNIKSIYRSYRLVWTFFANQLLRGFLILSLMVSLLVLLK